MNKYNLNNNIKSNHQYLQIDMSTNNKNFNWNSNLKNYARINNNNESINFKNSLRKYEKRIINLPNANIKGNGKAKNITRNEIQSKNYNDFDSKKDSLLKQETNKAKKIQSNISKTGGFRNNKFLQNYSGYYKQKNLENNNNKKYGNNNNGNNYKFKVQNNNHFSLFKDNKIKCFNLLENYNNEYFALIAKEKKKILEQKLIEYFLLKGKEKKDKIFKYENIGHFILDGIDDKKINNMKSNEKVKEILLFIQKFNLNKDEMNTIMEKLNFKNEAKKRKINKLDENEQKNVNDNLLINTFINKNETNKNYLNDKLIKDEDKENETNFYSKKKKNKKEKEDLIINQKLYGFKNEGNNCYLNSSLQLLTRINELKKEVINFNENYTENDTQGRLIIEFRNMLNLIEGSSKDNLILNPSKLKRIMGNIDNKYNHNGQEDSNEFIANFISGLLSETGNKEKDVKKINIINESDKKPYENLYKKFYKRKGDSFILNLFYGISKVRKFCEKCYNNVIKFNVYNMLEFPLYNLAKKYPKKELTLQELYNNYTEERQCEDMCPKCESNEVYSKTSIFTLPKYLLISFGRACDHEYFYNNILYSKNFEIKCELENNKRNYMLDCVIEHSGGYNFGHYTTLIPVDSCR